MKPTLEEIAQAYKEFKAVSAELSIRSWEQQLKAFDEGKGRHPQDLRHDNVKIWMEARAKFFGLMNQLVSEEKKEGS